MERIRRMLSNFSMEDNTGAVGRSAGRSRFERSSSFKKRSMRRTSRVMRRRAVVTNRGIFYVDESVASPPTRAADVVMSPATTVDSRGSTTSYSDWIQVTDDENDQLATGGKQVSCAQRRRKKTGCRNFSLEGKSVPFDSPLPSSKAGTVAVIDESAECSAQVIAQVAATNVESSTCGSSCTSGIHSMEKCKLDHDVDKAVCSHCPCARAVRRKPPTVLATKDNLRRSMRRLTGKRLRKATAKRDSHNHSSKANEEVYRMFSRLPLLFADRSPTDEPNGLKSHASPSPSSPRAPLTFNRQNPITKWLEESEKLVRRDNRVCERPLWSELVSYTSSVCHGDSRSSAKTDASPSDPPPSSVRLSTTSSEAQNVSLVHTPSADSLPHYPSASSMESKVSTKSVDKETPVHCSPKPEPRCRRISVREKLSGFLSSSRDRRNVSSSKNTA